jgi:hypothetical protein
MASDAATLHATKRRRLKFSIFDLQFSICDRGSLPGFALDNEN